MLKIAYILTSDISRFRGSTLKVKGQVEAWIDKGMKVEVFARVPDLATPLIDARRYVKHGSMAKNFLLIDREMVNDIQNYNPDLLYIRQSLPNRLYYSLQKLYPNVIEIVSDEIEENLYFLSLHKSFSALIKLIVSFIGRKKFLNCATGVIAGTHELAAKERYRRYCNNIKVIPNSVHLESDKIDIKKKKNNGSICNLFFIGSPGFTWHGIDKIEKIAKIFGNRYKFHIVGIEGNNTENINYYGYLEESEYNKILENCQICIGTFALHRKNQNECTTIKFCEYLKKGFPVIVPYKETSVLNLGAPDWILELSNNEDVLEIAGVLEKIDKFCMSNMNRIVSHGEASPYIDADRFEGQRLSFFKDTIKSLD